jgi:NhaP-type Na+/H+ or K+/H+ antiporter
MHLHLGRSYLDRTFIAWGGIAGALAIVLISCLPTSHFPEHEAFMRTAEPSRPSIASATSTTRSSPWGLAAAAVLALIEAARALGFL